MQFRNAFVLSAALFSSGVSFAGPVVPGFDSNAIPRGYENAASRVDIGFTVNFFGYEYSQLILFSTGSVGFYGRHGTRYGRMDQQVGNILAPYIDSIDTRYAGGQVTYGAGTYDGQAAFGVNWVDVDYFGNGIGLSDHVLNQEYRFANPDIHAARNSYQLIIVDRSEGNSFGDFDFIFNYDSIQWASTSARVGWSSGWMNGQSPSALGTYFEVGDDLLNNPASDLYRYGQGDGRGAFLDGGPLALAGMTYTFQVRDGIVSSPIITWTIPEPETWAMLLAGLGIVGMSAKRRRRQG